MTLPDIWRDVSARVGFFTKETSEQIPEAPGCYAWFVPLWIYTDSLRDLVTLLDKTLSFDPKTGGTAKKTAEFNWDALEVILTKRTLKTVSGVREEDWVRTLQNPASREAFQQALMEASILMPPLYVGKADNLRARYDQHVEGVGGGANVFHSRFSQFASVHNVPLSVRDLLFVCIKADAKTEEIFRRDSLNELLEHVLMLLCRPPFSLR